MFAVDAASYRKADHPIGTGYDRRPNGQTPSSLVVHTTNGNGGSTLDGEARYLRDSAGVGAHYLVGKAGAIVQLLDPALRAWHAGQALPQYINSRSIGVEVHHAIGEAWTAAQHDAVTWLARDLMSRYHFGPSAIDTHRAVALPKGRKVDPSDWSDAAFYAWRQGLGAPIPAGPTRYRCTVALAKIRQGPGQMYPQATNAQGALWLRRNAVEAVDALVQGFAPQGSADRRWAHLASGAGFVHISLLEAA